MRKQNILLATAIFLACGHSLTAQGNQEMPRILSLDECRQLALENNYASQNAIDKIDASKELSREAFTKYFPNISAGGFAYVTNKGALQYTVNIPLKELGLGGLGLGDNFSYDFEFLKKGTAAGINLVQPIFMGGRIVNGNKLAHVGEEVAKLEQERTTDEVVLTVEKYYWQLATLNAKKQTLSGVIVMLDTLTAYVNSYVEAGVTTVNDLLQVKLRRNQMASTMVDLDNGINLVKMALSQYTGQGIEANIDVEPAPDSQVPPVPYDLYVNPVDAVTGTSGYKLLNSAVKASKLQERIALGDNLPIVAGGAGYYYEHLLGQNHTFGALYLTLSVPITDWWGGSHAMKRRKIETRMAQNKLDDAQELLMINMTNAWNDVVSAHDKIEIAVESISQATENLKINEAYYKAGMVTMADLLEAQSLFSSSHDDYLEAYGNFKMKVVQYRQATGQ